MTKHICTINGHQRSKKSVMAKLARELQFPQHFGGNLDALFDCLTGDVEGPIEIVFQPTEGSISSIGKDYDPLVATLKDAERNRNDLTFTLRAPR